MCIIIVIANPAYDTEYSVLRMIFDNTGTLLILNYYERLTLVTFLMNT